MPSIQQYIYLCDQLYSTLHSLFFVLFCSILLEFCFRFRMWTERSSNILPTELNSIYECEYEYKYQNTNIYVDITNSGCSSTPTYPPTHTTNTTSLFLVVLIPRSLSLALPLSVSESTNKYHSVVVAIQLHMFRLFSVRSTWTQLMPYLHIYIIYLSPSLSNVCLINSIHSQSLVSLYQYDDKYLTRFVDCGQELSVFMSNIIRNNLLKKFRFFEFSSLKREEKYNYTNYFKRFLNIYSLD